jgi:hypothetical protein
MHKLLTSLSLIFLFIAPTIAQVDSDDNYTGFWNDGGSWDGGSTATYPEATGVTGEIPGLKGSSIQVLGYITRNGNLTVPNVGNNSDIFLIVDTLVISGDFILEDNSKELVIPSGGLLVVFGDFEGGNRVDILNGGTFVVRGNVNLTGGQTDYVDNGGSFYTDGTITGNASAEVEAVDEPISNLDGTGNSDEQSLFDFINANDPVNVPLPVELVEFRTENSAFEVDLIWSTASEENTSHFELYKSYNGQEFFFLDKVSAAGFSSSLQTYTYKDTNPSEGFNFYKLVSVDYDGYTEVFEVILNDFHFAGLQPYPNPFDGQSLSLSSFEAIGELDVMVTDLMGRVVLQTELKDGNYAIEFAQPLKKGFYMLKVRNVQSNYNYSTRLIVK